MERESRGTGGGFWPAAAGLRLLKQPRGSADAAQEKRNDSNNPGAD